MNLWRLGKAAANLAVHAAAGVKGPLPILYHVAIVVLSGAIAASLPFTFGAVARRLLVYWSVVEDEKLFLMGAEAGVALVLVLVFSRARTSWKNRTLGKMARSAGMAHFIAGKGTLARRARRRSKERQAFMRDLMIIGSTGSRTLVDPGGDLHTAIQTCRAAKVMLLHPEGRGAAERVRTIADPEVSLERLRGQIRETVALLGTLRTADKDVRLKLYEDPPLLKLAILGDYAWVQHYHPGLDVRVMPEYVFVHGQNPASLYMVFYRYFVTRWNDPAIPEYDLLSGELVYRDGADAETRRERLDVG